MIDLIVKYYETRKLKWPSFDDAMKFAQTEIGEVYEIDLAGKGYTRNNPSNKPVERDLDRLEEELGDAITLSFYWREH
jgi:NTP pyrophosphatase (non-canonical NTP hydrolase)